jgi:hypothetical protein
LGLCPPQGCDLHVQWCLDDGNDQGCSVFKVQLELIELFRFTVQRFEVASAQYQDGASLSKAQGQESLPLAPDNLCHSLPPVVNHWGVVQCPGISGRAALVTATDQKSSQRSIWVNILRLLIRTVEQNVMS